VKVFDLIYPKEIFIKKRILWILNTHLDNYLGKNSRYSEKNTGNGFTEVCDFE
jgi:hypothetical protein